MCTEKIKIEISEQELALIGRGLYLYESRVFDSLIELAPEQFGSYDEIVLREELGSVRNLLDVLRNKEMCYGKI